MRKYILFGFIAGAVVAAALVAPLSLQAKGPRIGEEAPEFTLQDPNGEAHTLSDYRGKFVVLEWTNYGCPFVKKHYDTKNMQGLQKEFTQDDVVWLSICSSAKGKQGYYEPDGWKEAIEEQGVEASAVLLDPSGKVGRTYGAKTTPHMFVVDPEGTLVYKGAIDDKPSTNRADVEGAHNYVATVLRESAEGKPVTRASTKPYGCSVKYK